MNQSKLKLLRLSWITLIGLGLILPIHINSKVLAQNNNNPLMKINDDNNNSLARPLTTEEEAQLRENIEQLDQEAKDLWTEGKADDAFLIWYQELILYQSLDRKDEIKALAKIGQIAWDNNRKEDVRNINQRLETIELETETFDEETLQELGLAYENIKNKDRALNIYQKIYNQAQANNDLEAQEKALNTIGQLHLNWFDYVKSAQVYEELLAKATAENNPYNQFIYLEKLAYIYNQSFQTANALKIKQQIAQTYINNQELEKLARLKIEIGTDYEILEQAEQASKIYQEAFTIAWGLQQLSVAGDALEKLAKLYYKSGYADYALQIYQELLKVDQLSYDYYGLMTTYEQMGDIYREQKNYPQAIFLFQKALEVAQSLQYQQNHFQNKIQETYAMSQPQTSSETSPEKREE